MSADPTPDFVVKPARLNTEYLPVIAVAMEDDAVALEGWEKRFTIADLPAILASEPPSLIATPDGARLLVYLDQVFSHRADWQYRVTPVRQDIKRPNGGIHRQRTYTVVNFFGFRPPPQSKRKGHYHHPVSPYNFSSRTIHELIRRADPVTGREVPRVDKLLEWGLDLRDWCKAHGLRVAATGGGIAGQLLRHPMFFPEARRKVPRATNARARPTLPGNYYRLHVPEMSKHRAYYLDMKSAHHNVAAELDFPDPNTLYARGHFTVTDDTGVTVHANRPWVRIGERGYNRVLQGHGLLYVHLTVPTIPAERFPPPYLETPGRKMAWVYTNELPMIRELGAVVDWVTAGWLSFHRAPGLNKYARWSMQQLAEADESRKRWLKGTLLATYGVLAARPRIPEFGFRQAKAGVPREYPAGSGMLQVMARIGDREQEVPTANVIYRGMIEADQRRRSLAMARELHGHGLRILAIYADSVFVEASGQLPILPPPWTVEAVLDELRFMSSTSFTSVQMTKMPGTPRESLDRLREVEQRRGYRPITS